MAVIRTALEPRSDSFRANAEAMRALVADLRDKSAAIALGGDEASRQRHESRGKLLRARAHPAVARSGLAVSRTLALRRLSDV